MTATNQNRLSRRQVLALRGLRLPHAALKLLREAGIYCVPAVSIDWQRVPDTYVIRGRESGGAVAQIGAYCGFAQESGEPLEWLERLDSVGRNGLHALVLAPSFVRFHVVRIERSYELLITRHRLRSRSERKRPILENAILFHGVRGSFPVQRGCDEGTSLNEPLPAFDNGFGKPVAIPDPFFLAARGAIDGARCLGCHAPHLLLPPTVGQEEKAL